MGRTSKADDPRIIKQTKAIYKENRALKTRDVHAIGVQDGEGNNIGLTTVKKIKKKHFKTQVPLADNQTLPVYFNAAGAAYP